MLIDILWQETLPRCWYNSSADSAVSGPLLYWLSHWSSLWSTKGMKKRKETSLASQHMLTHSHACNLSVSLLSHTILHACAYICPRNTQTCRSWDLLLHQGTHKAQSYNTKLYSVAAVTSVMYGQLYQGYWYHVGIGLDFLYALRAHTHTNSVLVSLLSW